MPKWIYDPSDNSERLMSLSRIGIAATPIVLLVIGFMKAVI